MIGESTVPYRTGQEEQQYTRVTTPRTGGFLKPITGNIPETKAEIQNNGMEAVKPAVSGEGLTNIQSTANDKNVVSGQLSSAHRDSASEQSSDTREASVAVPQETGNPVQMQLFDDKLLSHENVREHKLIGQVFDTYWIVEFRDKLYIIDQHAAHEKVLYERFMKQLAEKQQTSQQLCPPLILTLSMQEEQLLERFRENFESVGFEIEPFGGREYSVRAVPGNLYNLAEKELFLELLDGLSDLPDHAAADLINDKIATMSCKAAVKGNNRLSMQEADALIAELLGLENPYNCPHGRPTIISMTKYELEKKFKRVI
jgi:DNA mismatch repair protein MutL